MAYFLLHGEGSNGSTTATDSSAANRTGTRFGNAQVSTAQFKFGAASLLLDGNGDYWTFPSSANWSFTGDFTIDFWARKSADGPDGYDCVCGTDQTGSYATQWIVELNNNRSGLFFGANGTPISQSSGTGNPNDSTWHHWAVTRSGSTVRLFKDGTQVGSGTISGTIANSGALHIGKYSSYEFNGYIDELRIVKGVAKWTANFTPPTEPYGTPLTANVKNVAVAGVSGGLTVNRRLTAGAANATVAGINVDLTYTTSASYSLEAQAADTAIAGQSATLRADRKLLTSAGNAAVAGQSTSLRAARQLAVSPDDVAVAGLSAGLTASRRLAATVGNVQVSPVNTGLNTYRLEALAANVQITGHTVNFASFAYTLTALTANIQASGQPVRVDRLFKLIGRSPVVVSPARVANVTAPHSASGQITTSPAKLGQQTVIA